MNKINAVGCLLFASVLALSGCDSRVLDARNAEIVNGKIFEKGANKGFSGKITNISATGLLGSQQGYVTFFGPIKVLYLNLDSRYLDSVVFSPSLCDAHVRDGVPDGDATCMLPQSKILRYQMSFSDGALQGPFKLYDLSSNNNILSAADFKAGVVNGKQEIFSHKTQKLIYRANWNKGMAEGLQEGFDATTGNLTSKSTYKNGKTEGEVVNFAPDGKRVLYKATAVGGLKEGLEEQFDAETGKPLLYAQWSNGKRSGPFRQWDSAGKVLADEVYENDKLISSNSVHAFNPVIAQCVDGWMAAYRKKEKGLETIVTEDQMGEWASWCKAGKNAS